MGFITQKQHLPDPLIYWLNHTGIRRSIIWHIFNWIIILIDKLCCSRSQWHLSLSLLLNELVVLMSAVVLNELYLKSIVMYGFEQQSFQPLEYIRTHIHKQIYSCFPCFLSLSLPFTIYVFLSFFIHLPIIQTTETPKRTGQWIQYMWNLRRKINLHFI